MRRMIFVSVALLVIVVSFWRCDTARVVHIDGAKVKAVTTKCGVVEFGLTEFASFTLFVKVHSEGNLAVNWKQLTIKLDEKEIDYLFVEDPPRYQFSYDGSEHRGTTVPMTLEGKDFLISGSDTCNFGPVTTFVRF